MDAAIHAALALAIRLAEKEDSEAKTADSAMLVHMMRLGAEALRHYELKKQERKP